MLRRRVVEASWMSEHLVACVLSNGGSCFTLPLIYSSYYSFSGPIANYRSSNRPECSNACTQGSMIFPSWWLGDRCSRAPFWNVVGDGGRWDFWNGGYDWIGFVSATSIVMDAWPINWLSTVLQSSCCHRHMLIHLWGQSPPHLTTVNIHQPLLKYCRQIYPHSGH